MSTVLDQYFEILNWAEHGPSALDGLRDIFAENVVMMHAGEMVQGREPAVDFHRDQAARWKESSHHWTTSVQADGSLTGKWSQAGLDLQGNGCSGSGEVSLALDSDGRISRLHLSLTGGTDRARLLIARHLEVWMITDATARAKAMEEIYTEDITIMEPEDVFVGREAISNYIDVVQRKAPPLSGRLVSHSQNKEFIHWSWSFGFPGNKTALGSEVLHLRGDLIEKIVIFSADSDVFTEGTR
ncbi:nuclear transport factor 2 family protein [Streptomyces sp. NPDC089424]|uniref:nuclear transport factor 2 family protein n=1 Tax=Streptomyces sp. NPDC089424 TaxID=3365917 RepID=UPI0038136DD2